jgi:hypothetical protein
LPTELAKEEVEIYDTSAGAGSVAGGALKDGVVVEGVSIGKISETRFYEYFFASAKNPFISTGP